MGQRTLEITDVSSPLKTAFTISRGAKTSADTIRVTIREGEAVLSTEIDGIPVDISVGDQGVAVDEAAIEEARRRVDERRFEARNRREESAGSGGAAN